MSLQQNPIDGNGAPEQQRIEIELSKMWANRRGEAIIAKLVTWQGKTFIDIRKYFTDQSGRFAPTKKGFTLSVHKLPELARNIARTEHEVRKRGLIGEGAGE
jgi:Transcriptional Coactivator p15 (PC4)